MSEGPGQQPPQEPREVLEGLVIPSRRRPQPPQEADPRRQYISQAPEQPGPPGPQAQTWGSPPQAPGARQAAGPAAPGSSAWAWRGTG